MAAFSDVQIGATRPAQQLTLPAVGREDYSSRPALSRERRCQDSPGAGEHSDDERALIFGQPTETLDVRETAAHLVRRTLRPAPRASPSFATNAGRERLSVHRRVIGVQAERVEYVLHVDAGGIRVRTEDLKRE